MNLNPVDEPESESTTSHCYLSHNVYYANGADPWWNAGDTEAGKHVAEIWWTANDAGIRAVLQEVPELDWQRNVRDAVLLALQDRGVECTKGELNKLRGTVKPDKQDADRNTGNGRPLTFELPEPWEEPDTLAGVLADTEAALGRHLHLPEHAAPVAALWAAMTWVHDGIDRYAPYLYFTGAKPGCGKSTAMVAVGDLVPRRMSAAQISPAALYRTIEAAKPVMMFDNVDRVFVGSSAANQEIKPILLSAYNRKTAEVSRVGGADRDEVRMFSTWSPILLNGIGKNTPDLMERCIVIQMTVRPRGMTAPDNREWDAEAAVLRRRLMTQMEHRRDRILNAIADALPGQGVRNADLWRPLVGIATMADGEWPGRIAAARDAMTPAPEDGMSVNERAILAVRDVLAGNALPANAVCDDLVNMDDEWAEYGRTGKPITPKSLGRLLMPFGVKARHTWSGHERGMKKYLPDDIDAAIAVHLPDEVSSKTQ